VIDDFRHNYFRRIILSLLKQASQLQRTSWSFSVSGRVRLMYTHFSLTGFNDMNSTCKKYNQKYKLCEDETHKTFS